MTNWVFILLFFSLEPLWAQPRAVKVFNSAGMKLQLELVSDQLDIPWGFDFISDRQAIVSERTGSMSLVDIMTGKIVKIKGVPDVYSSGQGGLLDVKVSPHFQKDKTLYFTYAVARGRLNTTRLARAKLVGQQLKNLKVLFTASPAGTRNIHFGSRIALSPDGYLFLTVGDRGERERAQNLGDHGGKVIRLKVDGSIPQDNPFRRQKNALAEIWSYGHRNPQGLTFNQQTGRLFLHEHGPQGGDEINHIKRGANYGWPVITYGREYYGPKIGLGTHKEGMEQPLKYYVPSIAPSGMAFYYGGRLPGWKGNLFIGALKLTHLNRVSFDKKGRPQDEERLFEGMNLRVRNVAVGPDEFIYFSTDQGALMRIKPQDPQAASQKKVHRK